MLSGLEGHRVGFGPREARQEVPQAAAIDCDSDETYPKGPNQANNSESTGLSSASSSQNTSQGDDQQPTYSELSPCERDAITKHEVGWRRVVRNFAPSWFSVNMGTGIASILLFSLPYNATWLYWISVAIFALNVLLFATGFLIMAVRFSLYPEIFMAMISHPAQSMFIGTFPMGFCTIINMFVFVCVPFWGPWAKYFALAMWIVDVVVAVTSALFLPFIMMTRRNKTELSEMTALWLLPIVTTVVAAATGGIVAEVLDNPQHALWTMMASYAIWGIGVPWSMMVLVIYFQRLALHKLPPKEILVSMFLPIGPCGQGGYGILKLGETARRVFPQTGALDPVVGHFFYAFGFMVSLLLWSFGLVWIFFAVASMARNRQLPFNIGWWGFTFPLGVYAASTVQLGECMPSAFFRVVGTIISICVVILWMIVAGFTVRAIVAGKMLHAPCLSDIKKTKPRSGEKAV